MARRILFTVAALLLAGSAFGTADAQPDINLFGVFFLFFAFIAWFCWDDIQAGYAYLEERGTPQGHQTTLLMTRAAPLLHLIAGRSRGKR
jgi:hypothetical protein